MSSTKDKVSSLSLWWRMLPDWILIAARVPKTTIIIIRITAALQITRKDLVWSYLWEQPSKIILLRVVPIKGTLVKISVDPKMSQQAGQFKLSLDHLLKSKITETTSCDATHKPSQQGTHKLRIKILTQKTNILLLSTPISRYRSTNDKIKEVEISIRKFQSLLTKLIKKRNPPNTKI